MDAASINVETHDEKYYDDEEFENTDTVSISNNVSQPAIDSESANGAEDKATSQQREDDRSQLKADSLSKRSASEDSASPADRIPFQNVVERKDAPLYQTDGKTIDRRLSSRFSEIDENEEKSSPRTDSEKLRLNTGRPSQNFVVDNDEDDESDCADIDIETEYDADLLVAAYRGDIVKVIKLLKLGARYDARDRHRWTALMWAAAGGFDDIIEALVGRVKRPLLRRYLNAKDSITGWTALHVSLMHDEYGIKFTRTTIEIGKRNPLSRRLISHLSSFSPTQMFSRLLA